jgi:hypothetical protein
MSPQLLFLAELSEAIQTRLRKSAQPCLKEGLDERFSSGDACLMMF